MQERRPEMVPLRFPSDFRWTILEPVGECDVAVGKVNGIRPPLACDRILLRKNKAHNFAELDIVQEELDMYWVRLVLRRSVGLVIQKIFDRDHLDIGVFNVDRARSTKGYSNRSIPCE